MPGFGMVCDIYSLQSTKTFLVCCANHVFHKVYGDNAVRNLEGSDNFPYNILVFFFFVFFSCCLFCFVFLAISFPPRFQVLVYKFTFCFLVSTYFFSSFPFLFPGISFPFVYSFPNSLIFVFLGAKTCSWDREYELRLRVGRFLIENRRSARNQLIGKLDTGGRVDAPGAAVQLWIFCAPTIPNITCHVLLNHSISSREPVAV